MSIIRSMLQTTCTKLRKRRRGLAEKRHGRGNKGTGQRCRGNNRLRRQIGGAEPIWRQHAKVGAGSRLQKRRLLEISILRVWGLAKNLQDEKIKVNRNWLADLFDDKRFLSKSWKVKILGPFPGKSIVERFDFDPNEINVSRCLLAN